MSNINVSIEQVAEVVAHPNADRLEIVKILGTQTIVPKGEYKVGDRVVFFPPDILLPPAVSEKLGIQKYLKGCMLGGLKLPCRVAACRLRGTPSYGFIIRAEGNEPLGTDVSADFGAEKYEPPVSSMDRRRFNGDCATDHSTFHKYTDIQNYYRYASALPDETPVRITEKIHGTNSRVGYVRTEAGGYVFMGGSHKTNRKEFDVAGNRSLYWRPLASNMLGMLVALSGDKHDVIVFGELFGPGIQDLDYGVVPGEVGYQVFDITIDGQYIDWDDLQAACETHGIATVPLLYHGPFSRWVLDAHTDGPTTLGTVRSKFKGREGVVVTPLHETWSDILGGRLILKNKSADYLDRRGAVDNE
jgi:RNA ligase (TIGR02306 family)